MAKVLFRGDRLIIYILRCFVKNVDRCISCVYHSMLNVIDDTVVYGLGTYIPSYNLSM